MNRASSALRAVLPMGLSVAATRAEIDDAALYPAEERAIRNAAGRRRREFATARACARSALGQRGLEPCPVPVGAHGAPQWPVGIVGSITHCEGYRGCAVGRSEDFIAVGIDAEPNRALPGELLLDIALAEERTWVRELLRRVPSIRWDRLLFCAKEAVYKTWFPLTGESLDFSDATVSVDPMSGYFAASLRLRGARSDPDAGGLVGRWLARDGLVLAAIALPSGGSFPRRRAVG